MPPRFKFRHSFGWTFFVLILASFWNDATVRSAASPSDALSVATRSTSESERSALDPENVSLRRDAAEFALDAVSTSDVFETIRRGAARRVQDPTRRRPGDDFSFFGGSAKSPSVRAVPFADHGLSSTPFRSFWACQTASRPLFLTLRSLRN